MPKKFLVTLIAAGRGCWSDSPRRRPAESSRIPENSGGGDQDATLTNAPNSREFGYGHLQTPAAGNSTEQDAQAGGCGSQAGFINEQLVQAGWWFRTLQGSPDKVAQYQDLDSSPFWSVESLRSDSVRTVDFFAAGLDQEANDLHLGLYQPGLAADIQYQRYIDHTEPDWLLNFPQPVPEHAHPGSDPSNFGQYMAEDLNVGDDYAIRIQQLKAKFQGRLTDHEMAAECLEHAAERAPAGNGLWSNSYDRPDVDGNCQACHVLSQRQEIDWRTVEIEPVVETRRGPITVSFSLPIRSFTQSDQR
jgi:hypothetical protein